MSDLECSLGLEQFSGLLPLFPLPGVVLFPCSLLPLHIFEARYRRMVTEAMSRDGWIGLVMLRPGWEPDYCGNPPIFDTACLGKVMECTPLPDGRFNLVLCGVKRARVEAILSEKPYRTARVELVEDIPTIGREREADALRDRLLVAARRIPPGVFRHKNVPQALKKLDAPLGCSTDLLADSLLISPCAKQSLLEEADPIARADRLLSVIETELHISAEAPLGRRFPVTPSRN